MTWQAIISAMPLWFGLFYSALWRLVLPFALLRLWWKGRLNWAIASIGASGWDGRSLLGRSTCGFMQFRLVRPAQAAGRTRTAVARAATADHLHNTYRAGDAAIAVGQQTGVGTAICYLPFDAPWLLQRFLVGAAETGPAGRNRAVARCLRRCQSFGRETLADQRAVVTVPPLAAKGGELTRRMLGLLAGIAAQSRAWRALSRFGGGNVHVTGNIKFDLDVPADINEQGRGLAQLLSCMGDRSAVAGSTRKARDPAAQVLATHPLRQQAVAVMPRHPERWDSTVARARELAFALLVAAQWRLTPTPRSSLATAWAKCWPVQKPLPW